MPFLDAKALETDPDGMAFLRSVIRPNSEQREADAAPVLRQDFSRFEVASADTVDGLLPPLPSDQVAAAPVG